MSDELDILFRAEGALGHITLNRPSVLNALTLPMCQSVLARLADWASDPKIACVLIDAVPGRAFCSGGDIRAVHDWGRAGDPRALEFFAAEYRMNAAIGRFPKSYVALLDGIVMGGGAGISVHGKYRVATENALFAMPETGIGFFTDVGGGYFLSRCPGATGMYLGLTGARLRAADLLYCGLATHYVPSGRLSAIAPRLAGGEIAEMVLAALSSGPESASLATRRDAVDRVFSAPSVDEIFVRLTREGDWGENIARLLSRCSPTSLRIVHRQLREGAVLDLPGCLRMEFGIVREILKGHDFYEGVRAALIDKDHTPHWRPAKIEEVTAEYIERHFRAVTDFEP